MPAKQQAVICLASTALTLLDWAEHKPQGRIFSFPSFLPKGKEKIFDRWQEVKRMVNSCESDTIHLAGLGGCHYCVCPLRKGSVGNELPTLPNWSKTCRIGHGQHTIGSSGKGFTSIRYGTISMVLLEKILPVNRDEQSAGWASARAAHSRFHTI